MRVKQEMRESVIFFCFVFFLVDVILGLEEEGEEDSFATVWRETRGGKRNGAMFQMGRRLDFTRQL